MNVMYVVYVAHKSKVGNGLLMHGKRIEIIQRIQHAGYLCELSPAPHINLPRLTKRLQDRGIRIGRARPMPRPCPLLFSEIDSYPAVIYELVRNSSYSQVMVVVPVQMIVSISSLLAIEVSLCVGNEPLEFDLGYIENSYQYQHVIGRYDPFTIINEFLIRDTPLKMQKRKGLIIGHGYPQLSAECDDEAPEDVTLFVRDQNGRNLSFPFEARIDRHLSRKYEQSYQKLAASAKPCEPLGLFGPAKAEGDIVERIAPFKAVRQDRGKPSHSNREPGAPILDDGVCINPYGS